MGGKNQPHTLGDYSRPSHQGYRNTIELPEGNNVVPLRSDTIRLVQNGCAFHRLRSKDPNQHHKDFLKLVDSLDLNVDNESDGSANEDLTRLGKYVDRIMEMPRSQPIGYYIKHEFNKKTIKGIVDNHKYNDSLLATRLAKMDNETYSSLAVGPMYNATLKKKLARKDGKGGNFLIPCCIGRLKFINALADQRSDVNIMSLSISNKLTSENPIGTNIRLSIANHSYIYPLGITEDVLIDVAGFVYPVDFVILDIKKDEYMPLILGIPFLTTARAKIMFDKRAMTLKAGRLRLDSSGP
ncbi:MAK10-like protein [Tanacetum coccineum]